MSTRFRFNGVWMDWGSSLLSRSWYRRLMEGAGIELGKIGEFVGAGREGEVWEYGKKRVLKIFKIQSWVVQEEVFEKLRGRRRVAKIHGYGRLNRRWGWMECERLEKLEGRYSRVLSRCPSAWSIKSSRMVELCKLGVWLEGLPDRLNLEYWDLHDGNVMQKGGRLMICDLNGFWLGQGKRRQAFVGR